ncbi:MAG: hypothetical protein BWY16_00266 [Candidatus Omnitrophica bacterium ADurb.Bin205]|nr:MAG: hypothetical protein BWY16_00266 [Candidatus Omnitrophica bacterium ADurb.Bin205]
MEKISVGGFLKKGFSIVMRNPVLLVLGLLANLPLLLIKKDLTPAGLGGLIVYLLISPYLFGLIMRFVFESIDKKPSWNKLNSFVLNKYPLILLAHIIYYLACFVGMMLLVIPGVILSIRLLLCDGGILFDNDSAIVSLRRSWRITKGSWWRLFVLVLGCSLPVILFAFFESLLPKTVYSFVYLLLSIITCVWYQCVFTLAYLHLRERESK